MNLDFWLPLFFAAAMGAAMLLYVMLDGYDLGIGMLLPLGSDREKDIMIAAIGPFWDANETWIVLGVVILLIAFPEAHGIVLTSLYFPVTLMLVGLILRGIAFDFRVKAGDKHLTKWNFAFFLGSLLASLCQGWMLGAYITGMTSSAVSITYSILLALTLPALYIMLGCGWLLIKTEGELFDKALGWARRAFLPMAGALLLVSTATPVVSNTVADKWFTLPRLFLVAPIPAVCTLLMLWLAWALPADDSRIRRQHWLLYACLCVICLLSALGLAYSIFPYIIIGELGIWEAASSTTSLLFTFWGTILTLPAIFAYTFYVYRIFGGKTGTLKYESD